MEPNLQDPESEYDRLARLVAHYEEGRAKGDNIYLDSEDIEDICNFYIEGRCLKKADELIEWGRTLHPDDAIVYMLEAHVLIERKKSKDALRLLQEHKAEDDYYWYYLRAAAFLNLKEWDAAEEAAWEACRIDGDIETFTDFGSLFFEYNQIKTAICFLKQAEERRKDSSWVTLFIANCYRALNETESALSYVEKVLDNNPYSTEAWLMRASIHFDTEQYEESLNDFEYLAAINPNDEMYQVGIIRSLCLLNRDDEAKLCINRLEEEQPHTSCLCQMLRGDIFYYNGDYKKAHTCYYKGYDKEYFLADSTIHYMECKMRMKKWDGAISLGNRLLRYIPDNTEVLEMLTDCACEKGNMPLALRCIRKCIRLNQDDANYWLRYGSILLDMQEEKKAYSALHKAWKMMPEAGITNMMMAVMCCLKQDRKQMYSFLGRARKVDDAMLDKFLLLFPEEKEYIDYMDAKSAGETQTDKHKVQPSISHKSES